MTHEATLGALRRGGSHAAEPGRAGSRYTRGPGELRKQLGAEPAEAGAPSQELELTYRSVKKLFVLVSYCWGGARVWCSFDQTEAFKLTVCLNQSLAAYPGSIGA